MRRQRHIIALGGGGFSISNDDPKLCSYILEQSGRDTPRVCFIPTAGGDCESGIARFYKSAKRLGAKPSHLSLFVQPLEPLARFVRHHDIVYVGGGNTRNMLLLWKAWGLDSILRAAYERGMIFAGNSAGALCWFGAGLTDSYPGRLAELKCLGWLRGSFCPHYDSEPKRRPVYRALVRSGALVGGFAADDNVGLHFVNGRLQRIISSKRHARAHRVRRHNGKLEEKILVPDILTSL